jgi:hypothetical protein
MAQQAFERRVRAEGPVSLHCPYCLGSNLWCEELPRGDSPVECRSCRRVYIYAYVELFALDRIRRALHESHPERELAEKERGAA